MHLAFRLALAAGAFCIAACHRTPDADVTTPAASASPPAAAMPSPDATVPPAGGPAGNDYACADGTRLQASFGDHDATLRWADGRSLALPRAESASKGGGDVYVGDTVSLQRDGTRLQLHDGERPATDCAPATAPAADGSAATGSAATGSAGDDAIATRYACDAGTTLARADDGSFRAEIPGNPPIRLARIAGSVPPVFTGSSLYLRIEGGGDAILSQGDRADELRCAAARAPA